MQNLYAECVKIPVDSCKDTSTTKNEIKRMDAGLGEYSVTD